MRSEARSRTLSTTSQPAATALEALEAESEAPLLWSSNWGRSGSCAFASLSEHMTGSSVVVPLFVLGGAIIGYGIGTAF